MTPKRTYNSLSLENPRKLIYIFTNPGPKATLLYRQIPNFVSNFQAAEVTTPPLNK
jgi:hypothetical protein